MTKIDEYRAALRNQADWLPYLLEHSGLPGPRANLELAHAAAWEGDEALFVRFIESYPPETVSTNDPEVFPVVCGVIGLGRLTAEGKGNWLPELRRLASDPRWRVRESVCMGLQWVGDSNMELLLDEMDAWSQGSLLEQRAAAAALCEPRLLTNPAHARRVLALLDRETASLEKLTSTKDEDFRVLRLGLSYCWSVAAAALPSEAFPLFEKWAASPNPIVLDILKKNLEKNRLIRANPAWVENCARQIEQKLAGIKHKP